MKDKSFKKQLIGFGIAVVALVVLGLLSGIFGVYDGIDGVISMVSIGKDTIFKLLMAIVLVVCLANFVLIILKLLQSKKEE